MAIVTVKFSENVVFVNQNGIKIENTTRPLTAVLGAVAGIGTDTLEYTVTWGAGTVDDPVAGDVVVWSYDGTGTYFEQDSGDPMAAASLTLENCADRIPLFVALGATGWFQFWNPQTLSRYDSETGGAPIGTGAAGGFIDAVTDLSGNGEDLALTTGLWRPRFDASVVGGLGAGVWDSAFGGDTIRSLETVAAAFQGQTTTLVGIFARTPAAANPTIIENKGGGLQGWRIQARDNNTARLQAYGGDTWTKNSSQASPPGDPTLQQYAISAALFSSVGQPTGPMGTIKGTELPYTEDISGNIVGDISAHALPLRIQNNATAAEDTVAIAELVIFDKDITETTGDGTIVQVFEELQARFP